MSLSELSSLWSLCFGDPVETAMEFLSISDVKTLVEYSDGVPVAMASLVPVATELGQKGEYVYGVCVHPTFRGKGLFRTLMSRCECEASGNGAEFLCLIPEQESLFVAYKKMGYAVEINTAAHIFADSIGIVSLSAKFKSFAIPDGEPIRELKYGLLKPLGAFETQNKKFSFLHHMGEC